MSTVQSDVRGSIVERVKRICLSPDAEWAVIDGERASTSALISGYVAPLAGLSAVAAFIGNSVFGRSVPFAGTSFRVPIGTGIMLAVVSVVAAVIGVLVCAAIIDALAPTFGGQKSSTQAVKIAAYAPTPAWVAGLLQIVPALGLITVLGALYALYVLYLGLPRLMKCPKDKAVGYTAVIVLCVIVIGFVVGSILTMLVGSPLDGTLVQ